jgi:hypothetical protein
MVENLFELQTNVRESLLIADERLGAIETRLTKLEAEQSHFITAAGAAACSAIIRMASHLGCRAAALSDRNPVGARRQGRGVSCDVCPILGAVVS